MNPRAYSCRNFATGWHCFLHIFAPSKRKKTWHTNITTNIATNTVMSTIMSIRIFPD